MEKRRCAPWKLSRTKPDARLPHVKSLHALAEGRNGEKCFELLKLDLNMKLEAFCLMAALVAFGN